MVTGDTGKDTSLGKEYRIQPSKSQAISSPPYIFIVLLKHNYTHSLIIVCGCFHAIVAGLSSCDRDFMAYKD